MRSRAPNLQFENEKNYRCAFWVLTYGSKCVKKEIVVFPTNADVVRTVMMVFTAKHCVPGCMGITPETVA